MQYGLSDGVKIAEINARARATMVQHGKYSTEVRLRNNLVARPELLGKIAHPVSALANYALNLKPTRWLAEQSWVFTILPRYQNLATAFHYLVSQSSKPTGETKKSSISTDVRRSISSHMVGYAFVQVMEANGFEVIVPPQNCCGLPLLSNGEFEAARKYHENNVRNLGGVCPSWNSDSWHLNELHIDA